MPEETSSANQGLFLVQLGRARKHLRDGRLDLARQELEAAQIVRPNDEDVLNLVSVIEFKLGRYEDAARAARQLVTENPSSAVLHANLGLILFKGGALPEAEQELRKAIELKSDHARSHLYLGLLYRTRGRLGLALEHLRYAGAQKLVAEIEEILRRSMRDDQGKVAAADRSTAASTPPPAPLPTEEKPPEEVAAPFAADSGIEEPAEQTQTLTLTPTQASRSSVGEPTAPNLRLVPPAPEPPVEQALAVQPMDADAEEPSAPFATEASSEVPLEKEQLAPADAAGVVKGKVPVVASVGEGKERLRRDDDGNSRVTAATTQAEAHPLFQVRADGGLEVFSRGSVFVRKGSVVWYSGKIKFSHESAFQGTRFERILRAEGRGNLFLNDPSKSAYGRDLAGQSLFVEASRLLALDTALTFRLDPIHDFRNDRRVDILRVSGHGTAILSVTGSLLGHDVSHDFPLIVASRDLVAWSGKLVPSVVEDRFLEEVMVPDLHGAPKIRFEGQGLVLTEPPRARRRVSDVGRTTESDRRS